MNSWNSKVCGCCHNKLSICKMLTLSEAVTNFNMPNISLTMCLVPVCYGHFEAKASELLENIMFRRS